MSPKGFLSGSSVVLERAVQERRGSHQEAVNPLRGWWSPSSGGRGGAGRMGEWREGWTDGVVNRSSVVEGWSFQVPASLDVF